MPLAREFHEAACFRWLESNSVVWLLCTETAIPSRSRPPARSRSLRSCGFCNLFGEFSPRRDQQRIGAAAIFLPGQLRRDCWITLDRLQPGDILVGTSEREVALPVLR